jgi:TPR repeat protein
MVVPTAFCLLVSTSASSLYGAQGQGSQTPPPNVPARELCDSLANSPDDPNKIGAAVPFANIQVADALPACQEAALNSTPHYLFLYGRVLLAAQRYAEAFQQLRSAAEGGSASAMLDVGLLYHIGLGVPKSDTEAAAWLRKAADAGQVNAMYSLGYSYESGLGVPKSDADAATWYRKAADAGHPLGMSRLGTMYEEGRGVHQEDGEAVAWYREAARGGDVRAMYKLGVFYEKKGFRSQALEQRHGRIAPGPASGNQDYRTAAMWYEAAAHYHYDAAKINLGYLYQNGLGVRKDLNAARILYAQAAMSHNEQVSSSATKLYIKLFGNSSTIGNYAQGSVNGTSTPVDPFAVLFRLNAMSHANWNEEDYQKSEQETQEKSRKKALLCAYATFGNWDAVKTYAGCPF